MSRTILLICAFLTTAAAAQKTPWAVVIERVHFENIPLSSSLQKIMQLIQFRNKTTATIRIIEDGTSLHNFKRQVLPTPGRDPLGSRRVTFQITNIPADDLLRLLAAETRAELFLNDSVAFFLCGGTVEPLIERDYRVSSQYGEGANDLRAELVNHGIIFYEGCYARRSNKTMKVRTTQTQHDRIASLVD